MKTIGMIVAVEMDAVLRRYGQPSEEKQCHGFRVLTYQMDSYTMLVLNCGVGEIAAAAGVQALISECDVDMILNFGVVGGLTPDMSLTRTCVVDKVVHYDMDLSEVDGVEVGRYPDYPEVAIPTTPALVDKAVAICPELKRVVCASADKFVGDPAKKVALHEQYGADICEMEAAAVVLTCHRNGVPCLLIKTVSDSIDGGAEEFHAAVASSSLTCIEIADKIIREL